MKIVARHTPRGADLALADVEVCTGVTLFGVRVLRAPDGSHRAYARGAALAPAIVQSVSALILKGDCLNARHDH